MSSTARFLLASLFLAGCSAETASVDDGADADEQAITGVTDLAELEATFGFYKDFRDDSGNWNRGPERLTAGPCYRRTVGGPDGARYEFRRYTRGAAFFKKGGAGPASGDERPVVCVDYDTSYSDVVRTLMVEDFQVDAAIRYRLGAPRGGEGAAGSRYESFDNGYIRWVNAWCYETPFAPLERSALESHCLGELRFPGSLGMDGAIAVMVYQYAYEHGLATDRFSTKADPVGRFVNVEGGWSDPVQRVRFERLDAHRIQHADGTLTVALTPKGSDDAVHQRALALCVRVPGATSMSCRGL